MKLPAFYVLDCISKNVYDPYGRTFAPFIAPLFLETYGLVDISTRKKMEEMLLTWRKGSPDARELFGVSAQVTIERAIWGGPDSSPVCFGHHLILNDMLIFAQGTTQAPQLSTGQVLSELEYTLGHRQRALHSNPYDMKLKGEVENLLQVSDFHRLCRISAHPY
jgi:pre-mRNA cleavage complex 2 protein Pcf11